MHAEQVRAEEVGGRPGEAADDRAPEGLVARARRHPVRLALLGIAIAAAVCLAIAAGTGFDRVGTAFGRFRPAWLIPVALGQIVGVVGYAFAYRVVARAGDGADLSLPLALRLVAAGFGAFTVGGGFHLDYRAWRGTGQSGAGARVRVLGLGAIEYAVLAPAACISAIVLLVVGSKAQPSLLWPWAIAVPLGGAIALPLAAHRDRVPGGRRVNESLRAIAVMRQIVAERPVCIRAIAGMAVYWAAEIVSLWAALEAFGANLSVGGLIVAYATGYAATRRTLPLGGAGTTEALLTYSLHWVGLGIATALAAVVAYRVFNFVLTTVPALLVRPGVVPLFRAGDRGLDALAAESPS